MIFCIGGTGTGKTNALIDYLSRSSGEFHKIIICSFSTLDEPLYNHLQEKCEEIEFVNDVEDILDRLASSQNKSSVCDVKFKTKHVIQEKKTIYHL